MIHVPMADWQASDSPSDVFLVPGLGSCVGLVIYDPAAGIAGMAHIMLPTSNGRPGDKPAKFADSAVDILTEILVDRGAKRDRLLAKAAGGAQMFRSQGAFMAVGTRNADSVLAALEAAGIPVLGSDLGGTWGRTIRFFMGTWLLNVRSTGRPDLDL
jgi:chemotaxis protein CheD